MSLIDTFKSVARDTHPDDFVDCKEIIVRVTNIYGNKTIYPDCPTSHKFANLLGQKTLTRNNLDHIEKLGYHIAVAQPDPITL